MVGSGVGTAGLARLRQPDSAYFGYSVVGVFDEVGGAVATAWECMSLRGFPAFGVLGLMLVL